MVVVVVVCLEGADGQLLCPVLTLLLESEREKREEELSGEQMSSGGRNVVSCHDRRVKRVLMRKEVFWLCVWCNRKKSDCKSWG